MTSVTVPRPGHQVRVHLSPNHLYSAYQFACEALEIESAGTPGHQALLRHRGLALGSLMSSVAFAEAAINEFYAVCMEHPTDPHVAGHSQDSRFADIGKSVIASLAALWRTENFRRHAQLLDRYQMALVLAGEVEFDPGDNPYQDAKLAVQLRNLILHFVPEQRELAVGEGVRADLDRIERRYVGKFAPNPLAPRFAIISTNPDGPEPADWPWFPEKCLGSGCAFWSCRSMLSFVQGFFTRLGTRWYYQYLLESGMLPLLDERRTTNVLGS